MRVYELVTPPAHPVCPDPSPNRMGRFLAECRVGATPVTAGVRLIKRANRG